MKVDVRKMGTNNITVLISIIVIVLVSVVIGFGYRLRQWERHAFTKDAVQVIAYEASDLYIDDPGVTQEEIAATITSLIEASVILDINQEAIAVDPYGEPFYVEFIVNGNTLYTTVSSGGPDETMGSDDDIIFTHDAPLSP